MPHITTCSACGGLYEESNEETANEPNRLCRQCHEALAGIETDNQTELARRKRQCFNCDF